MVTTSSSAPTLPTPTAQTSFDPDLSTVASPSTPLPTGELNSTLALLACKIYQTYTSLCAMKPYTTSFPNASAASQIANSARASCLSYSASYYVPDVYDEAVSACAGDTRDANNFPSAADSFASAAANETADFCSKIGNVRTSAPSTTFGGFAVAATATSTTVSSTGGGSAAATGDGGMGAVRRSYESNRRVWAGAAAVPAVAVLI